MTSTIARLTPPKKRCDALVVRPLASDADWAAATELQVLCGLEHYAREEYEAFKQAQMRQYRQDSEAGHGFWYGAFLDGALVADLGIFQGHGVGRFQSVETHPAHRRRGFASQLVYESSRHALSLHPEHTLVIVATSGAPAMLVYEGVGYAVTEQQAAMFKRPPGISAAGA